MSSSRRQVASDVKETELKVSHLTPGLDYYFRVKAVNEFGTADPSTSIMYRNKGGSESFFLNKLETLR